ncbi:PepSY-associated TM helix domain-containing protein [Sphingomonas sp. CARO-RG-8B-R24-01]|uniref:PepSY-associated TM helix domain-containing protein n=1 Tax=Sphingomonas sp. CARO-RG-8B-R24-01 TaxID=2914831 RepID=UPI001F5AB390|nr:PepSY-associated TM helix domain-containing protein [Sphingomonas sp. CARO-RG-8B-R24-01]
MSKIALRNVWFQLHKWIGLLLAILIIPLSLSGAVLVWDEAVDHVLNPARYATTGTTTLDPQRYVAAARGALNPGERIASLALPERDGPVQVTAITPPDPARRGPPLRTTVYLDPPTAKILAVGTSARGVLRVLHNLHGNLLVPGVGRQIVGWIGVAMLLSSVSGLWLWWPTVGRWARGLRWRRHRNTDTNLHHLFGFWIALPLFMLSLTGVWIAFPQVFAGIGGGGTGPGARGPGGPGARPLVLERPSLPLDAVLSRAGSVTPGNIARVEWPTDRKPEWKVQFAGSTPAAVTVTVAVDDATGRVKPARPERETLARTMRRLHDGTRMGFAWQLLVFLGGILPAVLAVTGIIMWWRARGWKAALKAKQRARVAA